MDCVHLQGGSPTVPGTRPRGARRPAHTEASAPPLLRPGTPQERPSSQPPRHLASLLHPPRPCPAPTSLTPPPSLSADLSTHLPEWPSVSLNPMGPGPKDTPQGVILGSSGPADPSSSGQGPTPPLPPHLRAPAQSLASALVPTPVGSTSPVIPPEALSPRPWSCPSSAQSPALPPARQDRPCVAALDAPAGSLLRVHTGLLTSHRDACSLPPPRVQAPPVRGGGTQGGALRLWFHDLWEGRRGAESMGTIRPWGCLLGPNAITPSSGPH